MSVCVCVCVIAAAGVLSLLTVHPASVTAVKQILPKTLTAAAAAGANVLPHVVRILLTSVT